jgi:CO dehydrogenase maturation factor
MLRAIVDTIADSYPWVVIDNEAGLEHLSRRTTRDVDVLFIVSDATVRGITTAGRVAALLSELDTKVGAHYLIVNRAAAGLSPELRAAIEEHGLNLLAVLPDDPQVAAFDAAGRPLVHLPADNALNVALQPVVETMLAQTETKEAAGAHHR